LENYPIEAIRFVDSTLLPSRKRLEKICERLIERKIKKKLKWACSLRTNLVDEQILTLMKKAGCVFINYGFESGSQKMLDLMDKGVTVADNYSAARLTNEAGILVNSDMIINLPGETEEDMLATLDFLKNNKNRLYAVGLNPLCALPGSPYYREFLDQGLLEYSDKLWEEVGVLPKSIEQIRLYSQMPREKFIELYNKAHKIVIRINIKGYISVNWSRHPLFIIEKAVGYLKDKIFTFRRRLLQ